MKKWLTLAEALPTGHKTRTQCPTECGGGDTLSVNHDLKRYWCSCFRCGFTAQHDKGTQTLAQLKQLQKLNKQAEEVKLPLELPDDYTTEIPIEGRMWLYAAGLTETRWKAYRIGYSDIYKRVVLPVYDKRGDLIWYQCRAVLAGQTPKYIQPDRSRDTVVFQAGFGKEDIRRVMLVEDILSAIRVGQHIPCVSLLGTKITTAQAAMLAKYPRVTTWLDSDKAGRLGSYRIRRTLGLVTEVDDILTELDPKCLTDREIRQCIKL